MEFLKTFPNLLFDMISKIIPGFFFLIVFQNQYLPPSELLLKLFQPVTLPPDWLSWYRVGMILGTSYFIGVVIAIAGNVAEEQAVRRHWYARIKSDINAFITTTDQIEETRMALTTSGGFIQFIDHCRDFIYAHSTATAAILERYRTAYRLFFGLAVLFLAIPIGQRTLPSLLSLIAVPVLLAATYYLSRRYLCKSMQLYAIARVNIVNDTSKTNGG